MPRTWLDVTLGLALERRRQLARWRELARRVAEAVRELHPEARVYVAGSVARGEWTAASDLDVVVVLDREPSAREAARIIEHVWERLNLPPESPLQLHVVGPTGFERFRRWGLVPVETV